ncbi:hypothetical protein SD70_11795 [Gordoniibacillus kamchatkensis]|uniref:DNA-binding response regulator n=1 Tax=Gordoniibacillus kamchatkensis TaxID=1590651 RepID=A0ABR5AI79_9BACL|nr:response regulator [Paenibacillus sp. VKM B-2647]KIL40742.1 hypothetical protein SD70_11795 [Paenibacillus sp. VKM B-2647]
MYKALIVDDEFMIKKSLHKMISESEYGFMVVGEAEDGQEALEVALQTQPDLIVTDISMPVMDGLELIQECRLRGLPCEIVILSGFGEFEYARKALRSNVTDYLLKPVRPEQMDNMLRTVRERLDLRQKLLLDQSNWSLYCKRIGNQIARFIWDLDENGIRNVLADANLQYVELGLPQPFSNHLCFELLLFIQKELETYDPDAIRNAEFTWFNEVSDPEDAWRRLENGVMEHLKEVRVRRNHGSFQTIKWAAAYIEQHYMDEELSLQTIADRMNMSLSYASQSFKDFMGKSFVQYLTGLRMEKAKELLLNLNSKTYEVAREVGYNDYPHFTRTFKKYFGYTPKDYRSRMGLD